MTPEEKNHWMELAILRAKQASHQDEVPIGAILVRDGLVIGEGFNNRESSKRTLGHAELVAIEDYNQKENTWRFWPGTSLFVTVEPCLMCVGALLWARVDEIYYGCPDPRNAGLRSLESDIQSGKFDHRFSHSEGGILENQCRDLIQSYFIEMRARKKLPDLNESLSDRIT